MKTSLQSNADILQHGQMRKDSGDLTRTNHAPSRNLCGLFPRNVMAVEPDGSPCRRQKFREEVEKCSLTGAVGTNKSVNSSLADPEIHVTHRDETLELFNQVSSLENVASIHFGLRALRTGIRLAPPKKSHPSGWQGV